MSCTACPAGQTSAVGSGSLSDCVTSCPANQYYDSSSQVCAACPANAPSDAGSLSRSDCKAPPTVAAQDAPAAKIGMALQGEGLWTWVKANTQKFIDALTEDISKALGIDKAKIMDMQVSEGKVAALLLLSTQALLAKQSVDVTFFIDKGASTTSTPAELGNTLKSTVEAGTTKFDSVEQESGTTVEASVTSVEEQPADLQINATAATTSGQISPGGITAAVLVPLFCLCFAGAAVYFFVIVPRQKKDAEKSDEKSGDGAEGHEATDLAVLAVNPMQGDTPEEQISVDEADPEAAENTTVIIDSPSSPGPPQKF